MKQVPLFSNAYKPFGWILFTSSFILAIGNLFGNIDFLDVEVKLPALYYEPVLSAPRMFSWVNTELFPTLVGSLFTIGSIILIFSKEKEEDEMIGFIRLNALLWAVGCNAIYLLFCFLFVFGVAFANILVYNIATIPLIFLARFYYQLYKAKKMNT